MVKEFGRKSATGSARLLNGYIYVAGDVAEIAALHAWASTLVLSPSSPLGHQRTSEEVATQ